jgi:hypothetical protein
VKPLHILSAVAGVVLGMVLVVGAFLLGKSTLVAAPHSPVVLTAVQELAELATIKQSLAHVFSKESDAGGALAHIFGKDHVLLVAHGEVVAGVDLKELKPEDVVIAGDRISIRLPPPKILYSRLLEESTYVVDRKTGLLVKFDKDLERQARLVALNYFVQAARAQMILPQSAKRARLLIENVLKQLGYRTIEIS